MGTVVVEDPTVISGHDCGASAEISITPHALE
jgi:hypothetical protein